MNGGTGLVRHGAIPFLMTMRARGRVCNVLKNGSINGVDLRIDGGRREH
jgi:hypothetical protein